MIFFTQQIFFDDGYASYIKHEDIRVVCAQTENAVFEDIHPNSRDFVRKYLLQYPERPMVKLSTGNEARFFSKNIVSCTQVTLFTYSFIRPGLILFFLRTVQTLSVLTKASV